jgi:tetratricopeptide (TPR) repeat protein
MDRQKLKHVDSALSVGARLRAAREAAGMSQRDLAFPGCSAAYISRIERGERIPSLQLLRELGRLLGVSEEHLARGAEGAPRDVLLQADAALRFDEPQAAGRLFSDVLEGLATRHERGRALAGLGRLARLKGRPEEAVEQLEQARRELGPAVMEFPEVLEWLGEAYLRLSELESAIAVYEPALAAARERQDALEEARFAVLLADSLIAAGAHGRAEGLLRGALAHAATLGDPNARAQLYWAQSRLQADAGRHDAAARYARRALATADLSDHTRYGARAHQLLAEVELERGDAAAALSLLDAAAPLAEQAGDALQKAVLRLERARALARLGRAGEATALAADVIGALPEADAVAAGRCYGLAAGVFHETGDRARAIELYERAAELLTATPNAYRLDVLSRLAELLEAEGRTDEALAILKQAVRTQTESGTKA